MRFYRSPQGLESFSKAFAITLLCAVTSVAGQVAQYASVTEAALALNLTAFSAAAAAIGLSPTFSDIGLQVIILAPSDDAYDSLPTNVNQSVIAVSILYHIIPTSQPFDSLSNGGGTVITALRDAPGYGAIASDTVATLTLARIPRTTMMYAGGVAPGAMVNLSRSVTAGQSRIYLIDSVLLPPVRQLLTSSLPLTITEAILQRPDLSILMQLINADSHITGILSNPDAIVTLFAPSNDAFLSLLRAHQLTIADLLADNLTQRALLGHIVPGRPYTSQQLPTGSHILTSASPDARDVLRTTVRLDIRVSGTGNIIPALVTEADINAGKSVVHIINYPLIMSIDSPPPPENNTEAAAAPSPLSQTTPGPMPDPPLSGTPPEERMPTPPPAALMPGVPASNTPTAEPTSGPPGASLPSPAAPLPPKAAQNPDPVRVVVPFPTGVNDMPATGSSARITNATVALVLLTIGTEWVLLALLT